MSQKINLKELERKAWRSFFDDGLWDLYLGLLLLSMAISAGLSDAGLSETLHYGLYIGVLVLAMGLLWAGKRLLTAPRLGRVKFGPKRELNWVRLILLGSVVLGALLYLLAVGVKEGRLPKLDMQLLGPVVWVVNVCVVFGLGAYLLGFDRLYIIGVMYALAVPGDIALTKLTQADLSFVAFGVPATVILIMGLVVLIRFLRRYPVLTNEQPTEGGTP